MKPKFKVGDKVIVKNQPGVITEAPEYDERHLTLHGQLYTVELDAWKEEEYEPSFGVKAVRFRHPRTGETRGHASDILGCVPESEIAARGKR